MSDCCFRRLRPWWLRSATAARRETILLCTSGVRHFRTNSNGIFRLSRLQIEMSGRFPTGRSSSVTFSGVDN
jgi:hypothetical protein